MLCWPSAAPSFCADVHRHRVGYQGVAVAQDIGQDIPQAGKVGDCYPPQDDRE